MRGMVDARAVSKKLLYEVAQERMALHRSHRTNRPLSKDYLFIGLLGEWVFAKRFGLKMDLVTRPGGDGHVDFVTKLGTVDVKTARKPSYLFREQGKQMADILVLARYDQKKVTAVLRGWEYDTVMVSCSFRDFGRGVLNHYKRASDLRPMTELYHLLLDEPVQARLL